MDTLFDRHRALLDQAVAALGDRGFWTPFPEVPSGKIYGETAREDGLAAYESKLGTAVRPPGPPRIAPGRRRGLALGTGARHHLSGGGRGDPRRRLRTAAGAAWAAAAPETRVGVCLEALVRLNAMSFEMAQRGDAHHRPGLPDGLPGRRPARAGPRARGGGDRLGRDDAARPPTRDLGEAAGQGRADRAREALARGAARRRARHRLPDLPDLEQLPRPLRQPRHRQHR